MTTNDQDFERALARGLTTPTEEALARDFVSAIAGRLAGRARRRFWTLTSAGLCGVAITGAMGAAVAPRVMSEVPALLAIGHLHMGSVALEPSQPAYWLLLALALAAIAGATLGGSVKD